MPTSLRRLICFALLASFSFPLWAQEPAATISVPRLVRYSGTAKDETGKALSGTIGITFALYTDESGGAPIWIETQNVQADNRGSFTAILGATQPDGLPLELFTATEARWLSLQVSGHAEQTRTLLLSVPYALKAGDAETIRGLPPSAFVMAAPATASSGATAANSPMSATAPGAPPPLAGAGTVNFVPLWTPDGNTLGNSTLFQSGTGSAAKVGIGTTTPATTLDIKGSGTVRGSLTMPSVGTATATAGKNSQPENYTASAFNSGTNAAVNQTFRWQAEPAGNNTATPSGTFNLLFGSGSSTPTETGLKISNTGTFTFVNGQTFPGTGTITGITPGTGLTGGGNTGNVTLNLDTTNVPELNIANTFTGNQTVNGNLTATGVVTGSSYQIGSSLFAFGSIANSNAFLGFSGNATTSGLDNTATGALALFADTTGSGNTASGFQALSANTTGFGNTASGELALEDNTTGINNTATGAQALQVNSGGALNTADGALALSSNTNGSNNAAAGYAALANNKTGSLNTALGYNAGPDTNSTALSNSTAIGANAVVSESNALVLGGTGINAVNVGIGTATPAFTLDVHGTGSFTGPVTFASGQTFPNTISGVTAGTGLTGGGTSGNVSLNVDTTKVVTSVIAGTGLTGGGTGGAQTLNVDTSKIPQLAAANTFTNNQTVSGNLTATGVVSASSYQIGSTLFAFGDATRRNAFLGFGGNTSTTGSDNTAIGTSALINNTSGVWNTATGIDALEFSTTGTGNTAYGVSAVQDNTSGSFNTAFGFSALVYNDTGSYNTAIGYSSGPRNRWDNSTAIGAFAEVDESNALVLGSINGVNFATADTLVGVGITTPSYKLHVGNFKNSFRVEGPATSGTGGLAASFGGWGDFGIDASGKPSGRFVVKESGNVGVGTSAPDALLSVNGSADKPGGGSWGTFSDGRLKNLHGSYNAGLAEILKLHPVRYAYKKENGMGIRDSSEHVGFVAQEVQQVIPESVTKNDKGYLLVNNDPILWTMLNAIKEQEHEIQALRSELHKKSLQQASLEARLARIERQQRVGTPALASHTGPKQRKSDASAVVASVRVVSK